MYSSNLFTKKGCRAGGEGGGLEVERKLYRNGEGELYCTYIFFFLLRKNTMCDNCDKLGGCVRWCIFYFFLIDAICVETSYEC